MISSGGRSCCLKLKLDPHQVVKTKVRTGAGVDLQNDLRVYGLMFLYLLLLIIHVTKHASTQRCAYDDERGVP